MVSDERILDESILMSPTLFAMKVLNITPIRYQAEFLEDESPNIIIVGGRKIGKSTMLAIKSLWMAFVKPDQDILIMAPTYKQSKIVYEQIMAFIERVAFIRKHTMKFNIEEIKFDNNSFIRCLTASHTGEGSRGYSATMIIFDEAAFIPDRVFTAVEPALAVKGMQLILSSTPAGKRGYFYNSYANNPVSHRWHVYKVKSSESPLVTADYLNEQRLTMSENDYAQEFETAFIDSVGQYYPLELVMACGEEVEYSLTREKDYKYYVGADISRAGEDETGVVVIAVPDDPSRKIKVAWAGSMNYSDLMVTAREITRIAEAIDAEQVFIDAIGVGAGVYDMVHERIGSRANDIILEGNKRLDAYTNLRILMEKKRIVLNKNDDKFRLQFGSYSVEETNGGIRIVKSDVYHDDLVDALVLALRGVDNVTKYGIFEGFGDYDRLEKASVLPTALNSVYANVGTIRNPFYRVIDESKR